MLNNPGPRLRWNAVAIMALFVLYAVPMFAEGSQASCDRLVNLHLTETVISSANVVPSGTFAPSGPASAI